MFKYLVVGAGVFGATCARLLADAGKNVQVVERREIVGGNCADDLIDGIPVSRHGGHIFHTNARAVWDFVNRFGEWRQYEHRVKARCRDRTYSLPPNLATYDQIGMAPGPEADALIREMFFEGYSLKQWGKPFKDLPDSITKRVPIRYNYDDRYFSDRYQGVPEQGFTQLVARMLDGIPVYTGVDYLQDREWWNARHQRVIYSGAVDELFDHNLGRLAYRSLVHRTERMAVDDFQGCATVNYPDIELPFTRILEWKHYGWRRELPGETIVTMEYPSATGEPYYPVGDKPNRELYRRYREQADMLPWLRPGGRLGNYQYLNMDQAIAQAMRLVEKELSNG